MDRRRKKRAARRELSVSCWADNTKTMNEDGRIIKNGPLKGKKIEFASTSGIELFQAIAEEFMLRIFKFEAGEYLITDESSLSDFTGVDDMESADILERITEVYGIDVSDLRSGRLLEIFVRIHERETQAE